MKYLITILILFLCSCTPKFTAKKVVLNASQSTVTNGYFTDFEWRQTSGQSFSINSDKDIATIIVDKPCNCEWQLKATTNTGQKDSLTYGINLKL